MIDLVFEYFLFNVVFISFAYFYPVIVFGNRAIKDIKNKKKDNLLNYIISMLLLLFNWFAVIYMLNNMRITLDPGLFLYMNLLTIPIIVIWILINVTTIIYRFFLNPKKLREMDKKSFEQNINNPVWEDSKRKITHIILYISLIIAIFIATAAAAAIVPNWSDVNKYPTQLWEYNLQNSSSMMFFLKFISGNAPISDQGWVHLLLILIFLISGYIFTIFEAVRHSKVFYFPTNQLLAKFLRKKEIDSLASYFFLFLSMSLAAIILPPLLTISIIGVSCVGDLMASQFGMRWGKRKIKINPKKSWLGTLAGSLGSFAASAPFVGLYYGLITAIIFMFIDIFTEKPIKISDNLSVPIVLTITYIILNLVGFAYWYPSYLIQ